MSKHPSVEELVRYFARAKGDPPAQGTVAHLAAGCAECAQWGREMEAVLLALSAPGLEEAPVAMMSRALAWLEQRESSRTPTKAVRSVRQDNVRSAVRRAALDAARGVSRKVNEAAEGISRRLAEIQAILVFDTAAGALLPGIRGTTPATVRQLMYECRAGQLHLQVEPSDRGRFELRGQFLPAASVPPVREGKAILLQGTRSVTRRFSRTGEFQFEGLAASSALLRIEWGAMQITLDSIDLAQGANG